MVPHGGLFAVADGMWRIKQRSGTFFLTRMSVVWSGFQYYTVSVSDNQEVTRFYYLDCQCLWRVVPPIWATVFLGLSSRLVFILLFISGFDRKDPHDVLQTWLNVFWHFKASSGIRPAYVARGACYLWTVTPVTMQKNNRLRFALNILQMLWHENQRFYNWGLQCIRLLLNILVILHP